MGFDWFRPVAVLLGAVIFLSACAETRLISHLAKQASRTVSPDGETVAVAPAPRPGVKIGKPYQVNGIWYYPHDDPKYDQTGIASWYGDPFHGRQTANGEVYDQNELTAAHKTLPLPTHVRVTNLDNGRSIVLRVNDRGPFVNGRIIDVSRRAAQLLGFAREGTAKVRVQAIETGVQFVAEKPATPAEQREALPALPRGDVQAQQLAPPPGVREAPAKPAAEPSRVASAGEVTALAAQPGDAAVEQLPVKPSTIFVQAGAFARADNANRLRAQLAWIGPSRVTNVFVKGQELFRVRIGPIGTVEEADGILNKVLGEGIGDAQIVVD